MPTRESFPVNGNILHAGLGCSTGPCLAIPGTTLQGSWGVLSRGVFPAWLPQALPRWVGSGVAEGTELSEFSVEAVEGWGILGKLFEGVPQPA